MTGHPGNYITLQGDLNYRSIEACIVNECRGKAVPLEAWSGPEGSRKLRFPDFKTMTQNSGKVVSLMHWPLLPPGNAPSTHFC